MFHVFLCVIFLRCPRDMYKVSFVIPENRHADFVSVSLNIFWMSLKGDLRRHLVASHGRIQTGGGTGV